VVAAALLGGEEQSKSQYAEAAAAGDPLAVAGLFADSYRIGDADTVVDLLHPEFASRALAEDEVGFLSAWVEFEGALYGRTEPGASTCVAGSEDWYFCSYTDPAGSVLAKVGRAETAWAAQIVDGQVRRLDIAGDLFDGSAITNYLMTDFERLLGTFAAEADPAGSADACDALTAVQTGEFNTIGAGTVYNKACGEFLAGFVDDYAASLGN